MTKNNINTKKCKGNQKDRITYQPEVHSHAAANRTILTGRSWKKNNIHYVSASGTQLCLCHEVR